MKYGNLSAVTGNMDKWSTEGIWNMRELLEIFFDFSQDKKHGNLLGKIDIERPLK
jgi:hypothetical protein